jgi:outer membrane protein TolC
LAMSPRTDRTAPSPTFTGIAARSPRSVLGTLAFEIPLFARNQAERAVASARVEQARFALAVVERRAAQEVRLAAQRLRAARRTLAAFDAPITAALAENLAFATRAHEAGQIDFMRHQLLQREALDARRDRIERWRRRTGPRRSSRGREAARG